ncbi:MAG: hypothetical protein NC300_05245 [Bacteroidales bacterium]|nr:hypothetical protein [Clostridium sp.]MCM1203529.1 hypothetical protein [Bacteroidales bacterium]
MEERPRYFEQALSDFVYDAASGGAIRHLVDAGYSVEQMMEKLDYPGSRERVEQTVYRYMTESGLLLDSLPVKEEELEALYLKNASRCCISGKLRERIEKNGEADSYMQCPFGEWLHDNKAEQLNQLTCLTERERQYIFGIKWTADIMYHRLNSRMLEIGMELAVHGDWEIRFYFLREKLVVIV